MSDREQSQTAEKPEAEKKSKKTKGHAHTGPYARAFRAGRAMCPVCDAEKITRLTNKELEFERLAREALRRK